MHEGGERWKAVSISMHVSLSSQRCLPSRTTECPWTPGYLYLVCIHMASEQEKRTSIESVFHHHWQNNRVVVPPYCVCLVVCAAPGCVSMRVPGAGDQGHPGGGGVPCTARPGAAARRLSRAFPRHRVAAHPHALCTSELAAFTPFFPGALSLSHACATCWCQCPSAVCGANMYISTLIKQNTSCFNGS